MWPNITLNCLPQDHLSILAYLKKFTGEEENPSKVMPNPIEMVNKSRIEESLSSGVTDFSGLTKEEVAENCKFILQILPKLAEKSEMSDKNSLDSFLEKLYSNIAKCICNTCKSSLDHKLPNPEEKVKFAFHKIVEMQEENNSREQMESDKTNEACVEPLAYDTACHLFCVEYHFVSESDDMVFSLNDSTRICESTISKSPPECNGFADHTDLANTSNDECLSDSPLCHSANPFIEDNSSMNSNTFQLNYLSLASAVNQFDRDSDSSGDDNTHEFKGAEMVEAANPKVIAHVKQSSVIEVPSSPGACGTFMDMKNDLEISFMSSSSNDTTCFEDKSDDSTSDDDDCCGTLISGKIVIEVPSSPGACGTFIDMKNDLDISFMSSSSNETTCFEDESDDSTSDDDECCGTLISGKIVMLGDSGNFFDDSSDESDSEESDIDLEDDDSDVTIPCDDFNFGCAGRLMLCNLISAPAIKLEPIEDEYTILLKEANRTWVDNADKDWVACTPTRVSFNEVVVINEWDDSLDTRKSPWVEEGLNRMRFEKRIQEVNDDIGWIFGNKHRENIFAAM